MTSPTPKPPAAGPPPARQGRPAGPLPSTQARDGQGNRAAAAYSAAAAAPQASGTAASETVYAQSPSSTPRTWTLYLPSGLELLNANDRDGHWARRKRITRILRETTGWVARIEHVPPLERAHVLAVYEPPDLRRRDPANLQPSFKACVDGLVDVGVLPDDAAAYLDGPDPRLGRRHLGGRIVLHITELAAIAGLGEPRLRRAREARFFWPGQRRKRGASVSLSPYWADDQVTLHLGDCLEVLAEMEAGSVNAIVTDPPYGLEFMGREWDRWLPPQPEPCRR